MKWVIIAGLTVFTVALLARRVWVDVINGPIRTPAELWRLRRSSRGRR
jgi:hypothetical protein